MVMRILGGVVFGHTEAILVRNGPANDSKRWSELAWRAARDLVHAGSDATKFLFLSPLDFCRDEVFQVRRARPEEPERVLHLLMAVAVVASVLPAARAARVDVMQALRSE